MANEPDVDDEIESIAEEYDKDTESVRSIYESKLNHIKDSDTIGIDEDQYPQVALRTVRSNLQRKSRTGGGVSGEAEEIPILSLGNFSVFPTWGKDDDTVMVASGVVAPEDTEDENRMPGVATLIMKEPDGIDVGNCRELFQWGNHIRGWFAIEKLDTLGSKKRPCYLVQSTDRSKVESADFSGSLPETDADVRDFINNSFVTREVALNPAEGSDVENIAEAVYEGEYEEFGANWADLVRVRGQIVGSFRRDPEDCEPDENPFGKVTLVDDTAVPEEYENLKFMSEDDLDNERQPGLQVFMPPKAVKYGEDSTVDMYGTLRKNEETGQISMNGVGMAPLVAFERSESESGGTNDDTESESM